MKKLSRRELNKLVNHGTDRQSDRAFRELLRRELQRTGIRIRIPRK